MEMTLDDLDEIHHMLAESHDSAMKTAAMIDFNTTILPSPEKRELLNLMIDQMSGYLLEISHVDSFFQYCDLHKIPLTPQQQKTILACQKLCLELKETSRKVLKWAMNIKSQFNDANCPIYNEAEEKDLAENVVFPFVETVDESLFQLYLQWREVLKGIHQEVLFFDPENMVNAAGKRLDVMKGKQMFIETEHEMNMVMDYGLFQYRKDGKNVVERYYHSKKKLYSGNKLTALSALKDARFSFLKIIKSIEENALLVQDHLTDETLLMIDKGLYQVAKSNKNYAVLTHYLRIPAGFIMTTGASTPVELITPIGKQMWEIFQSLVRHHRNEIVLDKKSYLQCVADLFKIAIHEDVAKKVSARELPMNYHLLHSSQDRH